MSVIFAQHGKSINIEEIPEAVLLKFKMICPVNTTEIKWEYEHEGYEAYVKCKNKEKEDIAFFEETGLMSFYIFINDKGIRIGSEHEIDVDVLPEKVLKNSKKEKIRVAIKQLNAQEIIMGYRLIMEDNKQLNYDNKGRLIK